MSQGSGHTDLIVQLHTAVLPTEPSALNGEWLERGAKMLLAPFFSPSLLPLLLKFICQKIFELTEKVQD